MYPKYHVLLGFILSLVLFIFCEKINFLAAIIVFLSSFLIDIDHYLFLAWKFKQKNIFKAYSFGMNLKKSLVRVPREQRRKTSIGFYIFHGLEFLIILFLLGFFVHEFFYFILIGATFHLVLDYIEIFYLHLKIHKFSTIVDYICYICK